MHTCRHCSSSVIRSPSHPPASLTPSQFPRVVSAVLTAGVGSTAAAALAPAARGGGALTGWVRWRWGRGGGGGGGEEEEEEEEEDEEEDDDDE